jgi:hypothetical protein
MRTMSAHSPLLLALVLVIASAACSSDHPTTDEPKGPTFSAPITIAIGSTVGNATYAAGDSSTGGSGGTIDGVACDTTTPTVHIHAHLTLIADGEQRAIPIAVGAPDPFEVEDFVIAARCFYWLHTHDATGIVHLEAPVSTPLTLGQFFAIWGQQLTRTNVGGFSGDVTAYIDSTRYDGDLGAIPITAHEQITLIVGAVPAQLPIYAFPSAY